jgi:hypothetical protein
MRKISVALTALALVASLPLAAGAASLDGNVGGSVSGGSSLGGATVGGTTVGGTDAAVGTKTGASVALNAKGASKVTVDENGKVTNLADVTNADLAAWLKAQGYTKISAFKKEADGTLHATARKDGKKTDVTIDAEGNITTS